MNRKELFEQALKETGSLSKAVELVKTIESFLTDTTPPTLPQVLKEITETQKPTVFFNKLQITEPRAMKRWTPAEIQMANAMFDAGKTVAEVARATGRTDKGIRNALSNCVLSPNKDPRSPTRRASTLETHIRQGRTLRDYKAAEELLDKVKKG
jgi:hypothetical protein